GLWRDPATGRLQVNRTRALARRADLGLGPLGGTSFSRSRGGARRFRCLGIVMRFIQSDEDLNWHIGRLAEAHPVFAPLRTEAGSVPIRWLDSGFKGLVFVVTGQQ